MARNRGLFEKTNVRNLGASVLNSTYQRLSRILKLTEFLMTHFSLTNFKILSLVFEPKSTTNIKKVR